MYHQGTQLSTRSRNHTLYYETKEEADVDTGG